MFLKCPGQDNRKISAEIINCPDCGYGVEVFSDEIKLKCPKCKNFVFKKRLPSCLDWCQSARECIGGYKRQELRGG